MICDSQVSSICARFKCIDYDSPIKALEDEAIKIIIYYDIKVSKTSPLLLNLIRLR